MWVSCNLGALLSLEYGKRLKKDNRDNSGKVIVAGSNGPDGRHNTALVKGPGIVVGRKGSAGKVVWYDKDFWPLYTTYYVKPKLDCNLRWVYYLLFSLQLKKISIVTGVPSLNRDDVYKQAIKIPSSSEQHKIVEILDQADSLCRKRKEADKKASRILPTLFYKKFGNPTTNPMGWDIKRLDEVVEIGSNLVNQNKPEFVNLPNIGSENIEKITGILIQPKSVRESYLRSSMFYFTQEHVLYSKIRPYLNKVAFPQYDGLCSTDIYPLKPRNGIISQWYLMAILRSKAFLDYAKIHSEHLRIPKLNKEQLGSFRMPVPKDTHSFDKKIVQVQSINNASRKSHELNESTFVNLLHRSFSGLLTDAWRERHRVKLEVELVEQKKAIEEVETKQNTN
jgi:type I restriction enzyme, S subunit